MNPPAAYFRLCPELNGGEKWGEQLFWVRIVPRRLLLKKHDADVLIGDDEAGGPEETKVYMDCISAKERRAVLSSQQTHQGEKQHVIRQEGDCRARRAARRSRSLTVGSRHFISYSYLVTLAPSLNDLIGFGIPNYHARQCPSVDLPPPRTDGFSMFPYGQEAAYEERKRIRNEREHDMLLGRIPVAYTCVRFWW